MNFIAIAQTGFEAWATKPHNAKWFRKIDGTPIPNDLPVCIAQAFSDAFAARPAPGAGKAVDAAIPCHHCGAKVVLASVAPSGAEPVAWRRCNADEPGQWFDVTLDAETAHVWRTIRTNQIVEPLYASPQAVPAEDVANLIAATEAELAAGSLSAMDWNTRSIALVGRLLAALTGLSAERDDLDRRLNEEQMQTANGGEIINDLKAKLTASEAEAADLRTIISECAKALGNGAHIDPTCTVEFMQNLPEEIRLHVADLRGRLEEANAEIGRMTPKFVAYEYLESPAGREIAEARVVRLEKALEAIRDEPEVHTKLNQERLCCKFQDIASRALSEREGQDG